MATIKSIEEKARAYDIALDKIKRLLGSGSNCSREELEYVFPELAESDDERIRKDIVFYIAANHKDDGEKARWLYWLEKQGKNNMGISEATKKKLEDNLNKALEKETPESWNRFLDEQGEQKPVEWSIFDYRTWQYIVSDVLTKKDGIGQYLDDGECEKIAKYMQEEWSKRLSVEQRTTELPKGEDYGIDGLYAAIDILQKTLGEVDGYQSDDGILEHKCAISAVKELSKQQKSFWSEEDERILNCLISSLARIGANTRTDSTSINYTFSREIDWLKSLKDRYTWKPSDEQMNALREAVIEMGKYVSRCSIEEFHEIESLYNDLKELRGE